MSNGPGLLKLWNSALNSCATSQILLRKRLIYTSSTNKNKSERSDHDQQQNHSDYPSSSHQEFHRHSYEQKRSNYEKANVGGGYKRVTSLISDSSMNHYQRLDVGQDADIDAIKSAYYSLSKLYHPDIVGEDHPEAAEKFRLITESYDVLSDPTSRAEYDSKISAVREQPPTYTSWRPKEGSTNHDRDYIYRMREAGKVLRDRQDEAFEREKLRCPQKFRAGSFKRNQVYDLDAEAKRLEMRIRSLNDLKSNITSRKFRDDGSDFYRLHLYDTIQRKREDLQHFSNSNNSPANNDGPLMVSITAVVGLLAFLAFSTLSLFYDLDLGAALDSKLEKKIKMQSNKDT